MSLLALALGTIGFAASEAILAWMGTPQALMPEATVYLQINFAGVLFVFGYNFISTVLRALGDSRTPLRFVFAAVVLNAVLDPLLIAGFHLGIQGAAYATVVSQSLAFIYGLIVILRRRLAPFTVPHLPKLSEIKLIFRLGIPAGLQMMVISAGSMAMSVVNSFGEGVVAGYGAAQRLDSILMIPAQALGMAVNSMAGQNIGAKLWQRVHQIAKYGLMLNLGIMLSVAVLLVAFADIGIRLFVAEETALRFGADYLRILAFLYPFLGINFVLNGIVRASGSDVSGLSAEYHLVLGAALSLDVPVGEPPRGTGDRVRNRHQLRHQQHGCFRVLSLWQMEGTGVVCGRENRLKVQHTIIMTTNVGRM